ncbi:Leucine-rich repeat-containing protein sog2 [Diplodia seriata]|uniref:Leucine-rich repeat-containing protein sog2 n=1 Tax=Diplodia seriata TaxID=420778 RepID=A0A1S8B7W1_9PEZI|nr:Leucine-rich repeat-containing protein sog2 [Diplodia seriata]
MSEDRPPLSDDEVVALVRKTIEQVREDTTRRTEPDVVKDLAQPGITIDLGHHGIRRLPEDVIDIIKADIERLALSHNSFSTLPLRMSECARLRYLNVRYNALREFPPAILQLPTLEILDVSKNKIREIPEEISNLTSLKVLAIQRNRIERLPVCLGDISSLHMLKLDGNPIAFPPPEICTIKDKTPAPSGDNERDALITTQVKRYLRQVATRERLKVESEGDSSESNVETPRPPRSKVGGGGGGGGRFPVKPSISSLDSFGDKPRSDSPNGTPAPPIPARSHYRVQSQQNASMRRPPVGPLTSNGNERNRSHSEGAGAGTMRSKRMGMVTRKATTDLAPVNEGRPNGPSHSRGFSHGSALSDFPGSGFPSSSANGDPSRSRLNSIRPLSDLVEHKPWSNEYDDAVQACRLSAESALDFLAPTERLLRRVNLPSQHALMTQFQKTRASAYALSELVNRYNALTEDQEDEADYLFSKLLDESEACMDLLIELEIQMHDSEDEVGRAVNDPGVRSAWRAQINAQYMGAVEARNACEVLGVEFAEPTKADARYARSSTTPTQTMPHPDQRLQAAQGMGFDTNGNANGVYGLTPPMHPNGRTNTLTSIASAATPRSGESFVTLGSVAISRTSTMRSVDEADEEQIFERIWQKLRHACAFTLQNLPVCHERFEQACISARDDGERGHMAYPRWMRVLERSTEAHQAATSLNEVLKTIKLRDAEFRNSQRFWELCTAWVKAWSDLAVAVKQLGQMGQLPEDVKQVMKPVQKAVKEAGGAITASPWSHLAVRNDSSAVFPPQSALSMRSSDTRHLGHGFNGLSTSSMPGPINTAIPLHANYNHSATPSSSMGLVTPVPATPLSAALGAAAQATVPSTPGHAPTSTPVDPPMTGRFAGNVFERADRLLQQTQRRI